MNNIFDEKFEIEKQSFLDKLLEVNKDIIPDMDTFKMLSKKLTCTCRKCKYIWTPYGHNIIRNGHGCPKCAIKKSANKRRMSLEQFIEKARKVHGDLYDYSKVEYKTSHTKVCIIDPDYGEFWQSPSNHLTGRGNKTRGNKSKSLKLTLTKEELISKNPDLLNEYTFLKRSIENKNKIIVRHNSCGNEWETYIGNFNKGYRCPLCAKKLSAFRRSTWIEKGKKSKKFDSFKIYLIKCYNEKEEFIKIGRTFQSTNDRYHCKISMPYNYDIIKEIESEDGGYIFDLENRIQRKFKNFKYEPKIEFYGKYECFNTKILNYINI